MSSGSFKNDVLHNGECVHQRSGRPGFNPRLSHTKDSKMVRDATKLKTQHYKVGIKGKVEQSRQWSRALSYTSVA